MNNDSISGKLAAACAAVALAISAQAADTEAVKAQAVDEQAVDEQAVEAQAVDEQAVEAQAVDEQAVEAQRAEDVGPEQLELISLDDLPKSVEEEFDEDEEVLVHQPSEQESNLEELRRSFELYKTAVANASYDEADTLAKRMVELTIRLYGLDSHESAKALTNLGRVQQKNKDYESAVLNFTASIEIIERIEDRLNADLINPLRGLGAAQLGSGRPDLARAAFDRAVHVSHVNEGPHNLMQIRVLEELAETYLSMGETSEALDIHQFIYNLEARNTDMKSEAIIPALERQAEWAHRMRMHERERMTWRKIISIIEQSRGKTDLSLIPPLTGLGNSFLFVSDFELESYGGGSISSGDNYLRRAVRISTENPDATWEIHTQTLLTLGDYYTLSNRGTKARRVYQETWNQMTGDDEHEQLRASLLETPHVLQNIHPPKYYNSQEPGDGGEPPENFEVGRIVVAYNISSRGGARNIRIIAADPAGLEDMEYAVKREMRMLVHRPRMVNGDSTDTPDQTYTHEFFYRPADLQEVVEEQADETVAAEES